MADWLASCYHGVQTIKPGVGELGSGTGVSAPNKAHGKQRNEIIGKLDKKLDQKCQIRQINRELWIEMLYTTLTVWR